jgi:3-hydroxybutyryl-CoA dehydrogenase
MAGRLAVIGSGLMGSGIAQVAAQAGWTVTMRDLDQPSLDRGVSAIRGSLARFVTKERITQEEADATLARVTTTTELEAAADADVVVEAIFEKVEAKHEVFRALDKICKPGAVLGTNTSAIPITQIAAVTERPESVVGIHFFSPVPMMKLVELVRGYSPPRARSPRRSARPASRSSATSPASSPTGSSPPCSSRRSSSSSRAW